MSTFQEFKHKELFHWICNSFYVHASPSSGQKFPLWHQGSHLIFFDPPCSVNYSSHPGYVLGAGVCHRSCKQQAAWKLTKENIGLDWKHETNQADQNPSAYTSRRDFVCHWLQFAFHVSSLTSGKHSFLFWAEPFSGICMFAWFTADSGTLDCQAQFALKSSLSEFSDFSYRLWHGQAQPQRQVVQEPIVERVLASERSHSSCFVLLCVCFLFRVARAGRAAFASNGWASHRGAIFCFDWSDDWIFGDSCDILVLWSTGT